MWEPVESNKIREKWSTKHNTERRVVVKKESYYAVFFLVRRKKTFYIGRVTGENEDDNTVELKFLERKLVGSRFVYDWPRRDDVCCVE